MERSVGVRVPPSAYPKQRSFAHLRDFSSYPEKTLLNPLTRTLKVTRAKSVETTDANASFRHVRLGVKRFELLPSTILYYP